MHILSPITRIVYRRANEKVARIYNALSGLSITVVFNLKMYFFIS